MPQLFTHAEYADMIFVYGFSNGNESKMEYHRRFPNRRQPNKCTFGRVFHYSKEHGQYPSKAEHIDSPTQNEISIQIVERVEEEPSISTELGISQSKVSKTLKKEQFHPYHYQKVQELLPQDLPQRLQFCRWVISHQRTIFRILFSDEAMFTKNGIFNIHNSHEWARDNPHLKKSHNTQHRFSANIWLGTIDGNLVGPHIFAERLNGE